MTEHPSTRTYQPIAGRIVGNETAGFSTAYTVLAPPQPSRAFAISEGFTAYGCDDFNIAVIERARIVSWDWMDDPVDTEPQVLARIMRELGMPL